MVAKHQQKRLFPDPTPGPVYRMTESLGCPLRDKFHSATHGCHFMQCTFKLGVFPGGPEQILIKITVKIPVERYALVWRDHDTDVLDSGTDRFRDQRMNQRNRFPGFIDDGKHGLWDE